MTLAVLTPAGHLVVVHNDSTVVVPHTGATGHNNGQAVFEVAAGYLDDYITFNCGRYRMWEAPGDHWLTLRLPK